MDRRISRERIPISPRNTNRDMHPFGDLAASRSYWLLSPSVPPLSGEYHGQNILNRLRSRAGGIYYTKSNQFRETQFVDLDVIFERQLVPPHLIPSHEMSYLTTEIDSGSVRKEAVELLEYDYKETKTGKLSISGDLGLVRENHFE